MMRIINRRHACAERVTVVVSCVCVCVRACVRAYVRLCVPACLPACLSVRTHAILAVRAIRSITKDAIVLSIRFAAIDHLRWACQRSGGGIATVATRHFEWQNNPRVVCK